MSRVAVLKGGRSLERQVSLKSGARVEDALERLGHEALAIDVGGDLVQRLEQAAPDVAFVALHGRDGEDGAVQELLEILAIPYTASGVLACMRCWDKALAKHLMRDAGITTPDFYAFSETAFKELGAGLALPSIEERLEFPIVVKPACQGSSLGIKFARSPDDVPAALIAAFSYDRRVLLERHVEGRELAVSVIEGPDGSGRAADRRDRPARGGLLQLHRPLRDRPHHLRLSSGAASRDDRAATGDRPPGLLAVRLLRLRADRHDPRRRRHRAGARDQRNPRVDRDEPAAAGRRCRRDLVRRPDRAVGGERAGARGRGGGAGLALAEPLGCVGAEVRAIALAIRRR
jgi:hypothetical protein